MASTKKIRREIRKEFFGEEDEGSASQKISAFLKQLLHEDDDNSKILTFQPSVDITERSKALITV